MAAAVAALAIAAILLSDPPAGTRDVDAWALVLIAAHSVAPVARHRAPEAAVAVGLGSALTYAIAGYPVALAPVTLLSVYSAAVVLPRGRARLVLVAAVALAWVTTTAAPGPTDLSAPAFAVVAWLLGRSTGERRDAQAAQAERAVADERLRIARELHDIVAHSMSVVAVHAGTGRLVADDDPAAAREALVTIERATRATLAEMRTLLGVLRSDDSRTGREPAPGLAGLDALVADVVRSGMTVDLRVDGERGEVPAGIDVSAYRIVQEALTNVIKHAGRARATVGIRYAADAVSIEVTDDGRGAPTPHVPSAGGHGLVGMRERVALYGGDLDAGPRPGGGFRVVARLPFGTPT